MKPLHNLAIASLFVASMPLQADDHEHEMVNDANFGVVLQAGTLGGGITVTLPLIDNYLNVRGALNGFSYSDDTTESDIDYNFDFDMNSQGVVLDYHPFGGTFRLTAGVYNNASEFLAKAQLDESVEIKIGDETYTRDEIGELNMEIGFDSTAPYLGLGWGNSVGGNGGFSFACDIGVLFSGAPEVALEARGGLFESDPELAAELLQELEKEEKNLQEDLDQLEFFPVITMGIGYAF